MRLPITLSNQLQEVRVQPASAKLPNTRMSIGAFKVCAPRFGLWVNIPAPTAFIGDQRAAVGFRHTLHKSGIDENRLQPVVDRESVALDVS